MNNTNPLINKRQEENWDKFINLVKKEIVEKDKKLEQIPNLWGNEPLPLYDIIWKIPRTEDFTWTIDSKYKILKNVEIKINKLFERIYGNNAN